MWQTVAEEKILILVVEDVERLANLIVNGLKKAGFQAQAVHTASEGMDVIHGGAIDAMVLDLGLPDQDGLDLVKAVRRSGNPLPILILTTRITVADRVSGLDSGADDYLTKPFAFEELVARLRALLRRPTQNITDVLEVSNLTLNTRTRELEIDGDGAPMTPMELLLLEHLMRKQGSVVSKVFLEDNLYGSSPSSANSLEVLTHRLRARLRELGAKVVVHTVRGIGYMMTESDVS